MLLQYPVVAMWLYHLNQFNNNNYNNNNNNCQVQSMLGSPQTTISSRLQWSLLALPTSQLLTSSRRSEIK